MPVSKINFYVAALAMGIAAIAQPNLCEGKKILRKISVQCLWCPTG